MNRPIPIKIYGRRGNVNASYFLRGDTSHHVGKVPESHFGKTKLRLHDFDKMENHELLEIAFKTVLYSRYGQRIKENFERKSGETLYHRLGSWATDFNTGRNALYEGIKKEIQEKHANFHSHGRIDISRALALNHPSFRIAPFHLDEMIAIGGVQEVEVEDRGWTENIGYDYWDKNGKIHSKAHTTLIKLKISLKDWFGVDENDYTNFRPAAMVDRKGLAALWVLQHQRGYPPFINIFEHEVSMKIELGVCSSLR